MSDTLGVIGLGRMGLPVAERLLAAGYSVRVFDLADARMDLAVSAGAIASSSARELASVVDILVTVLPGPREFEAVMLGPDGALSAMRPGSCWLDLTSNDPRVATEAARQASARGVLSAGAPMAGGADEATAGTLGFYFGGTDEAFAKVEPLLATLGDAGRLSRVGATVDAGYTAKLLANLLWFGQAVAVTEALLLGKALNLDVGSLRTVLGNSPGGSAFIDQHLDALLAGNYLESFGIDRVVEELDTLTDLADETGTPFELSNLVARMHRDALDRFGQVDGELLAARLLEERAGTTLRAQATDATGSAPA